MAPLARRGAKLWDGVSALVRRPFTRRQQDAPDGPVISAASELTALEQAPHDNGRATALAQALLARADADDGFRKQLTAWFTQASAIPIDNGSVTNIIRGGTQHGPQ